MFDKNQKLNLIYNITFEKINNKFRKKSILNILKKSHFKYAFIGENHISLSNQLGVSITDVVIDSIKKDSFIYIEGMPYNDNLVLLLIYHNRNIIYNTICNIELITQNLRINLEDAISNMEVYLQN